MLGVNGSITATADTVAETLFLLLRPLAPGWGRKGKMKGRKGRMKGREKKIKCTRQNCCNRQTLFLLLPRLAPGATEKK